jgi:predicted negative regulator of RcsB-dependent stress response
LHRILSISYNKIGDVLAARQDLKGALEQYRKSLGMFVALARRDPANTWWERHMAVAQNRLGDLLLKNNEPAAALAAHRKSHGIYKQLAARDPSNAQWQTDLAGSCGALGAIAHEQSPETRRH